MITSSLFRVEASHQERKIVAEKDLPADTLLCRFWGPLISYSDTKSLNQKESYALQVSPDTYRLLDPPYRYFNHSCEPNCGLTPALDLIIIRPVKQGEELCWDYSTSMLERDWNMTCHCGKTLCRKVIGDFDRLPAPLQQFYISLNCVQAFILQALSRKVQKAS